MSESPKHSEDTLRSSEEKKNEPGMVIKQGTVYQLFGFFPVSQSEIVLISFILIAGAFCGVIYAVGAARGYTADVYDPSNPDPRFDPEPDTPISRANHYYWKLKPEDADSLTRLSYWFTYSLHQLAVWIILYLAHINSSRQEERYSNSLSKYNWMSIGVNVLFHGLHLLQTHLTYDGLAQDTLTASSQGSVIMLLVFVTIIEYRDRGMAYGWPNQNSDDVVAKYVRFPKEYTYLVRKYHGYGFAWAAVYTFWFHPMESTAGHLMGFFYTSIIMLQGSLMFTKAHLNRYWRLFLEIYVIIHGGVVAWQTGGTSLWPMFVFGFSLYFIVTQIFTLRFWYNVPTWLRFVPTILYIGVLVASYSQLPDANGVYWVRMSEVIRIPAVFYLAGVINLFLLVPATMIVRKFAEKERSLVYNMTMISGVTLFYGLTIGVGIWFKTPQIESTMDLILLMMIMISFYSVFIICSSVLLALSRGDDLTLSTSTENQKKKPEPSATALKKDTSLEF